MTQDEAFLHIRENGHHINDRQLLLDKSDSLLVENAGVVGEQIRKIIKDDTSTLYTHTKRFRDLWRDALAQDLITYNESEYDTAAEAVATALSS